VTIKKKYIKGNGEKRKREISDQKTMKWVEGQRRWRKKR
jgi:hypothetical protein